MARVLIIAYGNPLRCDDGLAWHLAEDLSHAGLPSDVEVVTYHQLTPDLASEVSQVSIALFIDAARNGVPGELSHTTLKPGRKHSAFTHECSPVDILSLAEELYGYCPEAFAISVCGECFDHGEVLSPKIAESLPRLAALVLQCAKR
jgi:hydrogenase maturation protease